ncbi:hypothetical protein [Stenotrophomonas oahuensis]|uniref:Uncharacterized protein n=1 Tax=Stenotrophomonas oahuensis TaxID=3003271 RepID=A0ABY9YWH0_9GAMM|nr:hypothetical protein [Stenotrophomonas sp. A5586]WNH54800.1 hypothetical protein PDM29_20870 [Stenotrophomonas sp. A5586]
MTLADLRFDHPRVFWTGSLLLAGGLAFGAFLVVPTNPFFEAIGINGAQRQLIAAKNAAYWYTRAMIHASAEELHFERRFGSVVRYDGALIAMLPEGDSFRERRLQFADVVILSPADADSAVRAMRYKNARFEIYEDSKSVVWIDGKPLNISLIESGAAKPDPDPPTNIVDLAFASYYWNQVSGENHE